MPWSGAPPQAATGASAPSAPARANGEVLIGRRRAAGLACVAGGAEPLADGTGMGYGGSGPAQLPLPPILLAVTDEAAASAGGVSGAPRDGGVGVPGICHQAFPHAQERHVTGRLKSRAMGASP